MKMKSIRMKLVRESAYNFHKTGDVKSGLGIGKRVLIEEWLKNMDIYDYSLSENLIIDSDSTINLSHIRLSEFPSFIQFGTIRGTFFCNDNNLKSLRGSPRIVHGSFYCKNNSLESLEFGPIHVDQFYFCNGNNLKSLEGSPNFVGGSFECSNNPNLNSLEGIPKHIISHFICKKVGGIFYEDEIRELSDIGGIIYVGS